MANKNLDALSGAGVSIWLDDLSRERLETGNLAALMAEKNVVGVTTNPTIFQKAVSGSKVYDAQLAELAKAGRRRRRGDHRDHHHGRARRVRRDAPGVRRLARARTAGSRSRSTRGWRTRRRDRAQAEQLWGLVDRENLFIKIPATREGLPAITETLAKGISVNVTLIFSLERYRRA